MEEKKRVKEIPRLQRYTDRPSLDQIFSGQKTRARDKGFNAAHISHGYTLKEIADYLGIHYIAFSILVRDLLILFQANMKKPFAP